MHLSFSSIFCAVLPAVNLRTSISLVFPLRLSGAMGICCRQAKQSTEIISPVIDASCVDVS